MTVRRFPCIAMLGSLLLLSSAALAPPAARAADAPEALHAGAWAFELDKDMGSSFLSENEISVKRMFGPTTAFRLSFGIEYDGGSGTGANQSFPSGTTTATSQSDFHRFYSLRLDWVHHFAVAQNFDMQIGIGPVASFGSNSSGSADATGYYNYYSNRTNLYGGEVDLGAEWFFANRFSLGGRAGLVALTGKQKYDYRSGNSINGGSQRSESDERRVFGDPPRILLTAYF